MRVRDAFAAIVLLTSAAASAQSQSPAITGDWLTDDGSAVIHVAMRGPRLWGVIARVLDPAAPPNDAKNPDPAARKRPLVGTAVLRDFSRSTKGWDKGQAYDPKAGRTYRSRLALDGPNRLAVTGCVLFMCQTKIWTRAR